MVFMFFLQKNHLNAGVKNAFKAIFCSVHRELGLGIFIFNRRLRVKMTNE